MSGLDELAADAAMCTRCDLCKGRTNVVFGMGNPAADLMFVGEGPGRDEDLQGLPFVGRSRKLLDRLLLDAREAERPRDCEQLEVERESLHEQQRQDLVGHLAAEHLQPDLRVANVEPEEEAHELLVEPARCAA